MKKHALVLTLFLIMLYRAAEPGSKFSYSDDFRDSPQDEAASSQELYASLPQYYNPITVPGEDLPQTEVEWIKISGGKISQETASGPRTKTIRAFYIAKNPVTVLQYNECVKNNQCTEPGTGGYCNWLVPGRDSHPVNCVSWAQAVQYAAFVDARLPFEDEWEFAATDRGEQKDYPWGNHQPDCDYAVMYGEANFGCGTGATWPVCSKELGNTKEGLCDMAGNLAQWTSDYFQMPQNKKAMHPNLRVIRGSSFRSGAQAMKISVRTGVDPATLSSRIGIRPVRTGKQNNH